MGNAQNGMRALPLKIIGDFGGDSKRQKYRTSSRNHSATLWMLTPLKPAENANICRVTGGVTQPPGTEKVAK